MALLAAYAVAAYAAAAGSLEKVRVCIFCIPDLCMKGT